jgi:hypothetical protein
MGIQRPREFVPSNTVIDNKAVDGSYRGRNFELGVEVGFGNILCFVMHAHSRRRDEISSVRQDPPVSCMGVMFVTDYAFVLETLGKPNFS